MEDVDRRFIVWLIIISTIMCMILDNLKNDNIEKFIAIYKHIKNTDRKIDRKVLLNNPFMTSLIITLSFSFMTT